MFIVLGAPQHYSIDGVMDYRGFLRAIPLLVKPDDVLAISSWGLEEENYGDIPRYIRQEIRRFLQHHQLLPDDRVMRERRTLELYKDDYPDAFAVLLPADPGLIGQICEMLHDSLSSSDLCTHIMGYGPRGALFCFHDAFTGGTLRISTRVPESQVADFCRLLNLSFQISDIEA